MIGGGGEESKGRWEMGRSRREAGVGVARRMTMGREKVHWAVTGEISVGEKPLLR